MWPRVFNIERQFSFYGGYRKTKLNILVHVLFVWPMVFGIMVLLSYGVVLHPRPYWIDKNMPVEITQYLVINHAFIAAIVYSAFYITLDNRAGFLAALLVLGCWMGGNLFAKKVPWETGWKMVLAGQVVCCTAQFLGRGPYEIGHPDPLENVIQTLLMAPYFVLLELLNNFGYVPYHGFKTRVQKSTSPLAGVRRRRISWGDRSDCSSSDSDCDSKCCESPDQICCDKAVR